ncbi:TPA: VirB8/TrbF family protein [Neisseria gonorrhoeae]
MGLKDIFRGREKADREMTENPYLNARKQWNFIMGDMVSSRLLWQWAGMTGLLIGLGGVGGMIYLGSQSKFIPYIVEVNKLGETVAVARADQPQATDERIVRAMLGSFIGNARTVTTDIALQRKYVLNTYAMLNPKDAAAAKMNEWLNGTPESSPFKRAAKELVSVEIKSVLRQSDNSWQVDWVETTRAHDGKLLKPPQNMRALLNIYYVPPTTEQQIIVNPIGMFIRDFSWSNEL